MQLVSVYQSGREEAKAAQASSLSLLPLISGKLDEVAVAAVNDGNVRVTDLHKENDESKSGGYITNKGDSNTGSGVDIDKKEVVFRNNYVIAVKSVIKTNAISNLA
eukprot:3055069-Ditylum_brightwellii.AAC.1